MKNLWFVCAGVAIFSPLSVSAQTAQSTIGDFDLATLAATVGVNENAVCPKSADVDSLSLGTVMLCYCTTERILEGGDVWGTNYYTDGSHLCRAAYHASAVDITGGLVAMRALGKRDNFSGSLSNSIKSDSWSGSAAFDFLK